MADDLARYLRHSYDDFPRIEEKFGAALDESLNPRSPSMLFDLVESFEYPVGSRAVDVGCGEGRHTIPLAERFGYQTIGVDPVPRHVELADRLLAQSPDDVRSRVEFVEGTADDLPLDDSSVDLVWCRDVLLHVADMDAAYGEFRRVLRPGGRALIYQVFATDRMEPREAEWLYETMGVVPASADPEVTESAIATAGLTIVERIELGTEWGEHADETSGKGARLLLHSARLLRDPTATPNGSDGAHTSSSWATRRGTSTG